MNSQLPDGYKQTEIGIIPEDWEVKRLKNISPSQSVGLVINPSSYFDSNGSVPMLVGSHINENGIDWESANRISNVSNNLLPSSRLAAGDLVTVRVGDPGLTAVVPSELDGCNCASMMIVRQHRSFDSCWLCYVMNSPFGRSQIEHVQYGTAQKQFNISDAIDFLYPVPLLNEQEAIAHALSDIDALIESLDRLLTKKRQIKQGAIQELLRFKKGWVEKKLEDIADVIDPHPSHRAPAEVPNGIPFIGIGDIGENGEFIGSKVRTVDEKVFDEHQKRYNLDDELIGLGRVASIGKVVKIKKTALKYVISPTLGVIRGTNVKRNYLLYALNSKAVTDQFARIMSGSTRSSVGMVVLRKLKIALPIEEAERDLIATILSDMDAEIDSIEAKLTKTRQIKQGMMHELLTGRIRLI
jgi:type I restriction enzyme, S subunit